MLQQRYPRIWGDPPLPPGTHVICKISGARGVVGDYDCTVGTFPVNWPHGMCEMCLPHEVIETAPPGTRPANAPGA